MHPSSADDLSEHLFQLERRLHDPAVRSNQAELGQLLAPDFREFGASGRVWTRPEIIAELASESPYVNTARDFACRILSTSLALVTYASRDGKRETLRSSLWQSTEGAWRIIFHQGTPIPPLPQRRISK